MWNKLAYTSNTNTIHLLKCMSMLTLQPFLYYIKTRCTTPIFLFPIWPYISIQKLHTIMTFSICNNSLNVQIMQLSFLSTFNVWVFNNCRWTEWPTEELDRGRRKKKKAMENRYEAIYLLTKHTTKKKREEEELCI